MELFVAQQPIFDKDLQLYAYELLFRSGLDNFNNQDFGDRATYNTLLTSFILIGLDDLTGGRKAFVNFTKNLID